jgi:ABC-type phosphate/phosphonate transport system substrate-binding protein
MTNNKNPKSNTREIIRLVVTLVLSLLALGVLAVGVAYTFHKYISINKDPDRNAQQKLQTDTLIIGILGDPSKYDELVDYLRSQFSNKVQISISGNKSISYEDARKSIISKEWDIAFTYSPMLSVAAKNNNYHFVARMFPDYTPYYQSALFTKSTSAIQSLDDLKSTNTIALGNFNSASSFYVPVYDLYGKSLRVDMGHRGPDIKNLVKTGKDDIGAAAYGEVANDQDLRIIHLSKQIPGSSVYLSPKLSESDRQKITKALLNAPKDIKRQANYGGGEEFDYSQLRKISSRTEEILKCANFHENPVDFYCSSPASESTNFDNSLEISGKINGWTRQNDEQNQEIDTFSLSVKGGKIYQVIIPRKILDQVPDASNPIAVQGKEVKIIGVNPQKTQGGTFELKITEPNQLTVL